MALLAGLDQVSKGAQTAVTLDKDVLFALGSVAADSYYGNPDHISHAKVVYRSNPSNQTAELWFNVQRSVPTAKFSLSQKALENFTVCYITLYDFDGGFFEVSDADIPNDLGVYFSLDGGSPLQASTAFVDGGSPSSPSSDRSIDGGLV